MRPDRNQDLLFRGQEAEGEARLEATATAKRVALDAARDALQPEIADLKDRISGPSPAAPASATPSPLPSTPIL